MKANKDLKSKRGLSEINLTSLVDVCLTLVIIFMVSYPMIMQSAIQISSPSLKKAQSMLDETELQAEIYLKNNRTIELNGIDLQPAEFPDSLRALLSISKDKAVMLSADEAALHDWVVAILDEAKQCGAKQLSIVRRKQKI